MTDFIIGYNEDDKDVLIMLDEDTLPNDYEEIGEFSDDYTGSLGEDNSVAFNRVKDALFLENGIGGITDMSKITIRFTPQTIAITPDTLSIEEAATGELVASITAPANTLGTDEVTWESDDTNTVTVDTEGVVTGVAAGSATITATSTFGGKIATCAVTVTTPK